MYGFCVRTILPALLALYAVGGLASLLVDAVWLLRTARKRTDGGPDGDSAPPSPEPPPERTEKPAAVLVPVVYDSPSAVSALAHLLESIDYTNYRIYATVYGRHAETLAQLRALSKIQRRLHVHEMPGDAPSGTGVCLNQALKVVRQEEEKNRVPFRIFVLHDIDADLHPSALTLFNHEIPEADMVQAPVFAYPDERASLLRGVILDDYVLRSTRDLEARSAWGCAVPSPGAGTAFSEKAMKFLEENGPAFDEHPLPGRTAGLRLAGLPGRVVVLNQQVTAPGRRPCPGRGDQEPVAALVHTPGGFADVLRERTRYFLSLSHAGGPLRSLPGLVFGLKDLLTPAYRCMALPAYAVLALFAAAALRPGGGGSDPLQQPWVHIGLALCAVAGWRAAIRFAAVCRLYGPSHGLLSIVRYPLAHAVEFLAALNALRYRMLRDVPDVLPAPRPAVVIAGEEAPPEDEEQDPESEKGVTKPPLLGQLLLHRRLVTRQQIKNAMRVQKKSGRRLGEVLVESGLLDEEDLVATLAHQKNKTAVEIDPLATPLAVLGLVPRPLAERYNVFPLDTDGEAVVLAADMSAPNTPSEDFLARILGRPVRLHWTTSVDLQFAIQRAYERADNEVVSLSERLGPRLVREGLIDEDILTRALRKQKRTNKRLGEVLVEMKAISHDQLEQFLAADETPAHSSAHPFTS